MSCINRKFSYKLTGDTILKIGPNLPKLSSNVKRIVLLAHRVYSDYVCCETGGPRACALSVRRHRWVHFPAPGVDQRDGRMSTGRGEVSADGKRNNLQDVEHLLQLPFTRR